MPSVDRLTRRNLPHWDMPGTTYFVTTCLEGSMPARGWLDIRDYRAALERRQRPGDTTAEQWKLDCAKLVFAKTDWWLDHEPATRHLADTALARIVENALFFFAGQRYDLLAYVVMPSHVHWVFRPLDVAAFATVDGRGPREIIQHSFNRFTSLECNKFLGRSGPFWQHESYDHWVRDDDELERIIRYVEANPVKAGLVEAPEFWPFSSARARRDLGLEFGLPLLRPK